MQSARRTGRGAARHSGSGADPDRFIPSAKEIASIEGLPGYPFAVIPHPIAGNTDDELKAKAEQALESIVRILSARLS